MEKAQKDYINFDGVGFIGDGKGLSGIKEVSRSMKNGLTEGTSTQSHDVSGWFGGGGHGLAGNGFDGGGGGFSLQNHILLFCRLCPGIPTK